MKYIKCLETYYSGNLPLVGQYIVTYDDEVGKIISITKGSLFPYVCRFFDVEEGESGIHSLSRDDIKKSSIDLEDIRTIVDINKYNI
jgi:hypothetical protein